MSDVSQWISVGELDAAFAPEADLLPAAQNLAGKTFVLWFEDGSKCDLLFLNATHLDWHLQPATKEAKLKGLRVTAPYRATQIRQDILCVNFIGSEIPPITATAVLDLTRGICTLVTGSLPSRAQAVEPFLERIARGCELTAVGVEFMSGAINAPFTKSTKRHLCTRELIGKRIEYTYSPTERYEHIYLNERYYSWHCLSGSERGLADTDRCHYRKLGTELYLFVWREKIVPTLGIVVLDLTQLRSTGQICGYRDFTFGALAHFPVGAQARVVSAV